MLPFSLRQLRQMRQPLDTQTAVPTPEATSALESGMPGVGSTSPGDIAALGTASLVEAEVEAEAEAEATTAPPATSAASSLPDHSPPARPLVPPPTLRRTDDAERESTVALPTLGSHPIPRPPSLLPLSTPASSGGLPGASSWAGIPPLAPLPTDHAPSESGESGPATTTTSALVALNAGTLLKSGRYRLMQRFSTVTTLGQRGEPEPALYLASDTERPSARVLIQQLPLADVRPGLVEQVFRRAVIRLELAGHYPAMPPLLDSFMEKGHGFVVFQRPAGERLSEILEREEVLSEADAIELGLRLLAALAELENASPPLIHGNLSPDNIVLQRSGQVVLVGLSPTLVIHDSGQIERGAAGGVRGYAAPEQQRGQADARSDLYAVAAILYHATTGQQLAQWSGPLYESARKLNPNISAAFDAILAQALRPAAAQRTQTVTQFRRALAALQPATATQGPAREPAAPRTAITGRMALQALPGPAGALRATMEHPAVRTRRRTGRTWMALAALILVSLLGAGAIYAIHPSQPPAHPTAIPTENPTAVALFHARGIGLSGGAFVFDAARPNGALKRRGAQAVAAHNPQAALAAFQQAMAVDKTDAEAALYAADAQVALSGNPFITMVAAVAFGADSAEAEAELQGIYLAQQRINSLDLLPGTTRLMVLVANSGPTATDAAKLAQLIVTTAAGANPDHIVGVVGWPDADQTRAAAPTLAAAHIPLVAPSAPVPGLSSPTYFALGPADAQQGQALADAASTVLHSQRVLMLRDPTDARAAVLAQAFATQMQQQHQATTIITGQETFSTGHTTDFTQPVLDAALAGDDTILVVGNDQDTAYLAQAVAREAAQTFVRMRILAPTWADTPALLGAGATPVAQLVRSQSAAMTAVFVAGLASVGEWSIVGVPAGEQPTFYADYAQQFGASAAPDALANPDATAILAYDAARLLGTAAAHAQEGARLPDPALVIAALVATHGNSAFQGVGGAISFTGPGAPANKALALLGLALVPAAPAGGPALATTVVAVVGGSGAFCGGPTCRPE